MLLRGTGVALILVGLVLYAVEGGPEGKGSHQRVLHEHAGEYRGKAGCPEYSRYASYPHQPLGDGPMGLPYQRPWVNCRTFSSEHVENVIRDLTSRMEDKDLSRLFENAFPNTLDTTIRWHVDGTGKNSGKRTGQDWEGAQSFIVTGDIDAEWLRDSTNQLEQYHALARKDKKIYNLILGAINTQAEFVIASPYCNAFQPPARSHLPVSARPMDNVHPAYNPTTVFECKYELDSLAHFLALSSKFYNSTGSTAFLTSRWYAALNAVLDVLDDQAMSTFDNSSGMFIPNAYTFQRHTSTGTETLSLGGNGNPLNWGTNLVRSAFRPSDDATILGFYIPANAMMAVQLKRTAKIVRTAGKIDLAENLHSRGLALEKAVWEHGVVSHKKYGNVFAYEVDGYGSSIIMDDANLPSLLSLPKLGFLDSSDETYRNTRKMLLSKEGNPYYLKGRSFHGIGGPHIGLRNAWPMSLLVQALTSDDDEEITGALELVKSASQLGLIHESIDVKIPSSYTRSWFAWANSLYSVVILDLAQRKPHLLFGEGAEPYVVE
ncbi:hypothetical protein GP486_001983 [Trichoglossum hirsutum]|uniref:Glycoside hydrolase family 125 protein n=1 Tax=Trichoglossum hirsutum TaxID=265104 RepID=A0A9P8LF39_9PEZI|nr:hypothetical protein GP486_001983 [Trichoglossum hirsutum]